MPPSLPHYPLSFGAQLPCRYATTDPKKKSRAGFRPALWCQDRARRYCTLKMVVW
jgi:hypothetical protein